MRYFLLILFAVLEAMIGIFGMFILKDFRGIIALPIILLFTGIVLKFRNKNDSYTDLTWFLLWGSTLTVAALLPVVLTIGKVNS